MLDFPRAVSTAVYVDGPLLGRCPAWPEAPSFCGASIATGVMRLQRTDSNGQKPNAQTSKTHRQSQHQSSRQAGAPRSSANRADASRVAGSVPAAVLADTVGGTATADLEVGAGNSALSITN